ncbi:AbrB/MazE/SpoVT family DNA-binding domain-containing protein [bacterium]|nr:AbrB/MazE/SpoVT family DNA-binding domain-containing protein [bacterium]
MTEVIVSTQYQVLIPKAVRDRLGIEPGQKLQVFPYRGRIELIPVRGMASARGLLAGITVEIEREDDRI